MTNKKIIIQTEVDASGAKAGLGEVSSAAKTMAADVKQAGKEAGGGLDGIGSGGEVSAAKVEKSTKSIVASIQRATALMEAGSKSSVKYYETLANQRGVSVDALRPYLDQLEKVNQSQVKVGISAGQTAAAMRGVPAQFTDIITSLQGGQAPLTVFLQQGGQLKDMFGGAGNAAKALGGYVFGLINPVTIATAAFGGLAYVYAQSNNEAKEFSKALITSNNAAGLSVDVLRNLSTNIEAVGASSRSVANDSLLSLVGAGNVASSMIEKAALAAVNAQTIMGKAVADTAKEFAELGKSPTAAVEKLNEKYHFLTMEIYDQIKAYEDQGRAADAAKLAQSSYADALLSQSSKVKETLTDWERGWLRIKNATSGAFDSVMTMFDDPTNEEKIKRLFKTRDELEKSQKSLSGDKSFLNLGQASRVQQLLDQNKAEINAIRDKIKAKNDEAKAEEEKNKQVMIGIEWSKIYSQSLDKQEKKAKEIASAENARAQALFGKNKAEIEFDKEKIKLLENDSQLRKVKSSIDEKYAQKAKAQIIEQSIAWKAHEVNVAAAGRAETKVLADIDKSIAAIKFPNPLKEITAEFEKQTASFVKINAGLDEYAAGLQGQNELAQLELSLIGESATERGILIEQYKIELALQKEIRKIKAEIKDAGSAQILIDKATSNAEIEKSQAAIKVQQQEWSKFYGDIYNGLTDSLYRGFEAGKGFFQSFWDGIKNLFKTTVLKLAVQVVMTGVLGMGANGLANAQGLGAQSNGLSSLTSMYSAGKSLWDGFSAAGTVGGGVTALGNALGSSTVSAFGSGMAMSKTAAAEAAKLYAASGNTTVAGGLSAGSSVGAALPIVGWVLAGMAANNSLYDQGWGGKSNNDTKQMGIASGMVGGALKDTIQKWFGLSDKSASMWSGSAVVNRLFGHKLPELQQSELAGSFNSKGFDASIRDVYKQKGGVFRGDIWSENKNPIADAQTKELSTVFDSMKLAAAGYASTLGLSTDALNSFSKDFKVNLSITGDAAKDAEANKKIWSDLIVGVADDLSKYLAPSLAGLAKENESASTTLARLAGDLSGVNNVLTTLGIDKFKSSLEGAGLAGKLIEASGGIEKFTSGAAFFADNFLSEAEKIKPAIDLVASTMASLGQSSVDTIPEFKDLVKSLDLSSESGAKMYAQLINIAPQFKAVADYTAALNGTLSETEKAAKDAADAIKLESDIAQQRAGLQDEYNQLTMTSAQLLALQRDALFDSNKALFDSVQAVKASQASEQERIGLQSEYNQLTMTSAELLTLQRNALFESNRALFDSTQALRAKQAAEQEAARVASEIAAERVGLQNELNQLTMSEADLLNIKRNSYAASNQDIFDQIQVETQKKLQAQQQAALAEDAARQANDAAKKIRDAWQGLTDSVFDEVKRIRGLTTTNTAQGFAASQAAFTIANLKAGAGDQEAYKSLPDLSKALLAIAEQQAPTLQALRLIQAQTAASLIATSSKLGFQFPSIEGGSNYIPQGATSQASNSQTIFPSAFSPSNQIGGNDQLVQALRDEISELKTVVADLLTATNDGNKDMARVKDVLVNVTENGRAMQNEVINTVKVIS